MSNSYLVGALTIRRKLLEFPTIVTLLATPLAVCDQAIDKEKNYRANQTTKEACGFPGLIPPDSLAEISCNERAYNSQNGRQNEAFRLSFVAGHNELGNHSNDKAHDNCPKGAQVVAPVLNQVVDGLACNS